MSRLSVASCMPRRYFRWDSLSPREGPRPTGDRMPVRALTPAAIMVAGAMSLAVPSLGQPGSTLPAAPAPTVVATVPGDTALTGTAALVASSKAAYQAAWAHRQAGQPDAAVDVTQSAISEIERALMSDMDASSRRELVEVRGKLAGLRDVARRDVARAADGDVLNKPAVEGIEPQLNA